jgi:hypothetical protein
MKCPTCKNELVNYSSTCEWCGAIVTNTVYSNNNQNYQKNTITKNKFKIGYLIPGLLVFIIWGFGNIISESEKQRIFGQDDISYWLVISITLTLVGLILNIVIKTSK